MTTAEEAIAELKRRGITVSSESVLEEKGTTFQEFKKFAESTLKGSAKGLIDIVGGYGNLYDYLKKSKDPSAFSSTGIMQGIRNLSGSDLQQIGGYRGAYEAGQSAAPAMAMSALGLPGLFSRSALGIAGEGAVAAGTGMLGQAIAPDSPLAQFAIQASPYAIKGGLTAARGAYNTPIGQPPSNLDDLLRVGRMTPGEATGSRVQLAKETGAEASTKIGEAGNLFRQAQAQDVGSFFDRLLNRATIEAADPTTASNAAISAFDNYGKALSTRLRGDARVDFNAAKKAGGMVSTDPVVNIIQSELASIPAEIQALQPMRSALQRVIDEYVTPAKEAIVEPSKILGPTGEPAFVNITPAVPQQLSKISIDRLQKNLSAWGEAAYSGKADFGKGNIFEGVAPGQVKGIAIKVLRGFRESLDDAVNSGVAGADDLAKARDKFKANLQKIEEYSNYPLTKYFDVESPTALTPELVIDRLSKAKPSERLFLSQVLANSPDANMVLDTVRRSQLESLLTKSQQAAAGAAEGAPTLDLKTLLKELNNSKGDFNYLFPNAADRANASLAIQWLQKTAKTASEATKGIQSDAYAISRGTGATAQQGLVAAELASYAKFILNDPRAIADVVFNPDTVKKMAEAQSKGKLTKAADLATMLGMSLAKFAPRVGPMVETTQPKDLSEQTPKIDLTGMATIDRQQAIEELRNRGIPVEE
jgi:prefoldin subunit 5